MKRFPFYRQFDAVDCGPTCLRIIAKYHGKIYSLQTLRESSFITREGVSLLGISDSAENIGLRSLPVRIPYEKLKEVPLPCIAHWRQNHFIVIYKVNKERIYIADPAYGLLKYNKKIFLEGWKSSKNGKDEGILLLLEPTAKLNIIEDDVTAIKGNGFAFLLPYLLNYKKYLFQLFIGMLVGSILLLLFPLLTQSLVDFGINNKNIGFIYTILFAQLMLSVSRTSVDLIRSWLLLHIGTRINISLISDFLQKLMKLPITFFDSRNIGDILQRIGDHRRIEQFLTSSTLNTLFSLFNLIIFSIVLIIYSIEVFIIFLIGSILYISWILLFIKKRRWLDYQRFDKLSVNQSHLIQLITGMQEIKLSGSEKQMRQEWAHNQFKLFKISIKDLALSQYQQAGSFFINELKNIFITIFVALQVIDGNLTFGMMLAIQYIIGQVNAPIVQLLSFLHTAQYAKISLERLKEIHNRNDEEEASKAKCKIITQDRSIYINNLSFQYEGPHSEFVLKDIYMQIPQGKVTAIVGSSGSGKTTLLKILLKFYKPTIGKIKIGDMNFGDLSNRTWRQTCGVVMQDGYIFSDTIKKNIALGSDEIDKMKLLDAAKIANIYELIESLPQGYFTKIGPDGLNLSQGQKQRILIARAVYKNPEIIFFDEATNSLDVINERIIHKNLENFFMGKTVVIVAHRLSTVKNADQIVVLNKGEIIENGTHQELIKQQGAYYRLVRDQLELDS